MKARIVILVAALAAAFAVTAAAQAQAVYFANISSGSPGPWLGSGQGLGDVICSGTVWYDASSGRFVKLSKQIIGRSPAAPYARQDIYMQAAIYWFDGSQLRFYTAHGWQKRSVDPGYPVVFDEDEFNVSQFPGVKWVIRAEFRWYTTPTTTSGARWLGTAFDGFDRPWASGNVTTFGLSSGERGCQMN